jgi:hypothetical protein
MTASFLLIGQSNMAGRGYSNEVPLIINEGIHMLRNGRWQLMAEPIHHDRPGAGIGLAASFAAAWRLQNPTYPIGLIPCADGGTSLDDWAVGGALFDHAVAQAKLAQRNSRLTGILWHQGESDCFPEKARVYQEKLSIIIEALRNELAVPYIPLIVGGLGDFLTSGMYGQYFGAYPLINEALLSYAQSQPRCYYVTAEGLTANPDGLHFNAASLRILGIRYYEAFQKEQHIMTPVSEENELLTTIYNIPYTTKEKTVLLERRFACGDLSVEEFQTQLAALQQQGIVPGR